MIPWFHFTKINIGQIPIMVWGSFVALGMIIGFILVYRRSKTFGLNSEKMLDLALLLAVSGLVCARVFHVLFYQPSEYLAHPLQTFKIWQGGMSSFGGVFGAIAVFFWRERKNVLKDILKKSDVFAIASLYGWIVGRLGCFIIHDHLGRLSGFFLAIQTPYGGARLEMSMMEIIVLIPLAIIFAYKKKVWTGWHVSALFIYYGTVRFVLDFFRATDLPGSDTRYFRLTPSQYFGIVLVVAGIYLLRKSRGKQVSYGI